SIFQAGNLNINLLGVQHWTTPLDLFNLRHKAPNRLALLIGAGLVHHSVQVLHHSVLAAVPGINPIWHHAAITAVASHAVTLAAGIAVASVVGSTLNLPVTALAIAAILLQHGDFFNVLDGVGQLVDSFKITGRKLALSGNFFQFVTKLFFQFVHIFHVDSPFTQYAQPAGLRFLLRWSVRGL